MDIYIYIYKNGSSINHNLWFYLGSSIWMQGNSWDHNGNSNGENPWEEGCNDFSLNLELSRVILGVHLKSLKWVSWNKQYVIFIQLYTYHMYVGFSAFVYSFHYQVLGFMKPQWDGHDLAQERVEQSKQILQKMAMVCSSEGDEPRHFVTWLSERYRFTQIAIYRLGTCWLTIGFRDIIDIILQDKPTFTWSCILVVKWL